MAFIVGYRIDRREEQKVMKDKFDLLEDRLLQWGFSLNEEQKDKFSDYYDLLIEWNQVMNLTAITEFDEVVEKHFLDSISLAAYIKLNEHWKIIDVGTGAGFPGIPLKIMFPGLRVLLADSLNKRVRFLNAVIDKLKLNHIEAVHCRAEELAHKHEYREQYDLCVSRAVANLSSLSEYCLPYVKEGGMFAAYKSAGIEKETEDSKNAVKLLGGKLRKVMQFQLADTEYLRSFVLIDKVKHTPNKYPRKAGTPVKDPL